MILREFCLLIVLIGLGLLGGFVLLYPLRRQAKFCMMLFPCLFLFLVLSYGYWGGFKAWHLHLQQEKSLQAVQEVLNTLKTPQDLINRLKAKLDESQSSAQGWYLLGRLYSSQNDTSNAYKAFEKAYHFKPDNEAYAVEFAHSVWLMNQRVFTPESRQILNDVLKKNPNQIDALSLLAMDSFSRRDFEGAIQNWQAMLRQVPENSKEARALTRAIARAYQKNKPSS